MTKRCKKNGAILADIRQNITKNNDNANENDANNTAIQAAIKRLNELNLAYSIDIYIGVDANTIKVILSNNNTNPKHALKDILKNLQFGSLADITNFLKTIPKINDDQIRTFQDINIHFLDTLHDFDYNEYIYTNYGKINITSYLRRNKNNIDSYIITLPSNIIIQTLCNDFFKELDYQDIHLIVNPIQNNNYINNIYESIIQHTQKKQLSNIFLELHINTQYQENEEENINAFFTNNNMLLQHNKLKIEVRDSLLTDLSFLNHFTFINNIYFNHCTFNQLAILPKDKQFTKLEFFDCIFQGGIRIHKAKLDTLLFIECFFNENITIMGNIDTLSFKHNKPIDNNENINTGNEKTLHISGNITKLDLFDNTMAYKLSIGGANTPTIQNIKITTNKKLNNFITIDFHRLISNNIDIYRKSDEDTKNKNRIYIVECIIAKITITHHADLNIISSIINTLSILYLINISIIDSAITKLTLRKCKEIRLSSNIIGKIYCQLYPIYSWNTFHSYINQIDSLIISGILIKNFTLASCILHEVNIISGTFEEKVSFDGSIILKNFELDHCIFKDNVSLFNTALGRYVNFSTSNFQKNIIVEHIKLTQLPAEPYLRKVYSLAESQQLNLTLEEYLQYINEENIYIHTEYTSYQLHPLAYSRYFKQVKKYIEDKTSQDNQIKRYLDFRKTMNLFKSSLYKADNHIDGNYFYVLELMAQEKYLGNNLKNWFYNFKFIQKFNNIIKLPFKKKHSTIGANSTNKSTDTLSINNTTLTPIEENNYEDAQNQQLTKSQINKENTFNQANPKLPMAIILSQYFLLLLSKLVSSHHQNTLQAILVYVLSPLIVFFVGLFTHIPIAQNGLKSYLEILILPATIFKLIAESKISGFGLFGLALIAVFQAYVISQIFISAKALIKR
jgi:hypothetical protein